jgi:hypothetical protein
MDLTCVICLDHIENINEKYTISCEHMFHKNCINKYLNSNCPICKKELIKSNVNYINTFHNNNFKMVKLNNNNLTKLLYKYFTYSQRIEFLNLLNKNVLLTGSILLSSILNDTYENYSLDIVIDKYSEYKLVKKFLMKLNYIKIKKRYFNTNKYNNFKKSDIFNFQQNNIINKIIPFIKKNKKIFIIFNEKNKFLIQHYFDLDILKNYYDGTNLYIYDKTKLDLKIDYISKKKLTYYVQKRIIKYRKRGINIFITE